MQRVFTITMVGGFGTDTHSTIALIATSMASFCAVNEIRLVEPSFYLCPPLVV